MNIHNLDPRLRFAAALSYEMRYNRKPVKVTDCRIFSVTEGQGELQIGSDRYILHPGCLFYCCAGSIYRISTNDGFSFISLNFDLTSHENRLSLPISPEFEPNKWDSMDVFSDNIQDSIFLNSHLFVENSAELAEQVKQILTEHNTGDPLGQETAATILKLLLLRLHRLSQDHPPKKLHLVQQYIKDNYQKRITNQELAVLAGYHEYHLNRLFCSYTGLHLHQYLSKVRLDQARSLMLNTELPLQDIAERVGFGSYPHFSASFKAIFGISPAQYRKNHNSVIDRSRIRVYTASEGG